MRLLSVTYAVVGSLLGLAAIVFFASVASDGQPIAGRYAALIVGTCCSQSALANLVNYYRGHNSSSLAWLARAFSGLALAVGAAVTVLAREIHNELIAVLILLGLALLLSFLPTSRPATLRPTA